MISFLLRYISSLKKCGRGIDHILVLSSRLFIRFSAYLFKLVIVSEAVSQCFCQKNRRIRA